MIDVLSIEILKWRSKTIYVARSLGDLKISYAPHGALLADRLHRCLKIMHVLQNVGEDDTVKSAQGIQWRKERSDMSLNTVVLMHIAPRKSVTD